MSDRLDIVLIDDTGARIFHQRWGASALVATLLEGPERAWQLAMDGFAQTAKLDDDVAACVIDRARNTLVVAGRFEAIRGTARIATEELLVDELARAWPGWTLRYEPHFVVEPVVLYAEGVGLAIASLNAPHVLADATSTPRFEACSFVRAPAEAAATPELAPPALAGDVLARSVASLADELSIRAAHELQASGLATIGDVLALDDAGLVRHGISARTARELREIAAP